MRRLTPLTRLLQVEGLEITMEYAMTLKRAKQDFHIDWTNRFVLLKDMASKYWSLLVAQLRTMCPTHPHLWTLCWCQSMSITFPHSCMAMERDKSSQLRGITLGLTGKMFRFPCLFQLLMKIASMMLLRSFASLELHQLDGLNGLEAAKKEKILHIVVIIGSNTVSPFQYGIIFCNR